MKVEYIVGNKVSVYFKKLKQQRRTQQENGKKIPIWLK